MSTPTITYSVYSYPKKAYEYFVAPYDGKTHSGTPPKARGGGGPFGLGVTPEQVAWKLPLGAKKVGEGPIPKGKIASLGDAPGAETGTSWITIAGVVAAAYFLATRKRTR